MHHYGLSLDLGTAQLHQLRLIEFARPAEAETAQVYLSKTTLGLSLTKPSNSSGPKS